MFADFFSSANYRRKQTTTESTHYMYGNRHDDQNTLNIIKVNISRKISRLFFNSRDATGLQYRKRLCILS